mmetsp:Transcript_26806/g.58800  ORF Transcript_26806/g.58800 Transcript_26806/m.58800 type:complete len:133 (+) Transcript_26806:4588-4986(+)
MVPRHGCIIQRIFLHKVLNGESHIQAPIANRFANIGQTKTSSTKLLSTRNNINRDVPADLPRSQSSTGMSRSRNDIETSDMKSETMPPYSSLKSGRQRAGNHSSVESNASSYNTTRFQKGKNPVSTDVISVG